MFGCLSPPRANGKSVRFQRGFNAVADIGPAGTPLKGEDMFKRRRAFVLLLGAAATAAISLGFAQPSHASTLPPAVVKIYSNLSGFCVQPDPNNSGPDIQLIQGDCGSPTAQWRLWPLTNGNY